MMKSFLALFLLLLSCAVAVQAQRPFATDNADVTDKGKFHAEFGNQSSSLQRTAFPIKTQSGFDALAAYGIFKDAEINFDAPFLILINDRNFPPHFISGIGDSTLAFKYNFHKEQENSNVPALTVTFAVQFPTGNASRSLGSGVRDYGINLISQKTFGEKNIWRVNVGTLLAGNTLNGVLGFKAHGIIFNGGTSIVRKINEKLQLGAEISGAVPNNFKLNAGQLQFQIGGNYQIRKHQTFDFGVIVGHFAASPRHALQLGTSIDF